MGTSVGGKLRGERIVMIIPFRYLPLSPFVSPTSAIDDGSTLRN